LAGDNRTRAGLGTRAQATASQAFAADVGIFRPYGKGHGEDQEDIDRRRAAMRTHADWNAVLAKWEAVPPAPGKLFFKLDGKVAMVKFTSTREEVLTKGSAWSEFSHQGSFLRLRGSGSRKRSPVFRAFPIDRSSRMQFRRAEKSGDDTVMTTTIRKSPEKRTAALTEPTVMIRPYTRATDIIEGYALI